MCGIAGTLDLRPGLPPASRLVGRMTDLLAHRGPDDAGLLVDPPVVLGHRRLSIIDLSPLGHQPMEIEGGRFWITYNGEVYNYVELAAELRARGHAFRSSSDTEVLLRAYAEWGSAALRRLNGMFAFAIWDRVEQTLFCARDRLGIKPFYYTEAGGRFRFASEIKALLLDPSVPRVPNDERVLDFLVHELADHTPETMFAGILQLPPGSFLTVDLRRGVGEPVRWYRPEPREPDGRSAAEALRELLVDSVSIRLRSDVPVGTCLSGGLDSSSIVAVASRLRREQGASPPSSFSARCHDPRLDEGPFVDAVGELTGAPNHSVVPRGEDAVEWIDRVLWHMDEPFHGAAVFGQWKVMELARSAGVTVLLDGQGGDEVLAGYHYMYPALFLSLLARGRGLAAARELRDRQALHGVSARRSVEDVLKLTLPRRVRARRRPGWLAPGAAVPSRALAGITLRRHQRFGLAVSPLPAYLHHEDRNSMSFGLEARVPLLDHRIVELGLALSPALLIRNGRTKWVLREALRAELPRSVVERTDKQGFTVAQEEWTGGVFGRLLEETLRTETVAGRPYFDARRLASELEARRRSGAPLGDLWRAFVLERWLALFFDGPAVHEPAAALTAPRTAVRAEEAVALPAASYLTRK